MNRSFLRISAIGSKKIYQVACCRKNLWLDVSAERSENLVKYLIPKVEVTQLFKML